MSLHFDDIGEDIGHRRMGGSHIGVTCDGCGKSNFSGLRYKCEECFDYDLCHECVINHVTSKSHQLSHSIVKIPPPLNDFGTFFFF